jgi:hypothetical protein
VHPGAAIGVIQTKPHSKLSRKRSLTRWLRITSTTRTAAAAVESVQLR